jgi:predicted PurR-regulated permease PerM
MFVVLTLFVFYLKRAVQSMRELINDLKIVISQHEERHNFLVETQRELRKYIELNVDKIEKRMYLIESELRTHKEFHQIK